MKQTADGRSDSQIYNWGIKKAPTLDGGSPEQSSLSPDVSSVGGIDASLDGARRLPNGSIPGGVSSDASEVSTSDTSIPTTQQNVNSGQAENSGSSEQRAKTNLGSKSTRAKTSQAVETLMEADITPEARQEQLNPYNTRPSPLVRVYATVSAMSREREQLPPSVLCTGL